MSEYAKWYADGRYIRTAICPQALATVTEFSTEGLTESIVRLIAAAPDLLAALEQIQTLNAGKDCDIKWLCEKAIEQARKED